MGYLDRKIDAIDHNVRRSLCHEICPGMLSVVVGSVLMVRMQSWDEFNHQLAREAVRNAREKLQPATLLTEIPRMLIWNELIEFMGQMQRRLEEKETDPDKMGKAWKTTSVTELEEELRNQVIQLGFAFRKGDPELIRKKAVDVANYCMMIYDNLG